MKEVISFLVFLCISFTTDDMLVSNSSFAHHPDIDYSLESKPDCICKGINLYGRVQFVESFPDLKIQIVESFPDIKVKLVESFPDACGEWQVVESFPDFKVQVVESFPDLKVQYVESFPGMEK
jgi:hypothetical protein